MIPPEVRELLEPLERFERIRRRASRLGDRLADLSYANPYGGVQEKAREILHESLRSERLLDLQYSPFGGKTQSRRAVADSLRESHELPFVFSDIILTPGAMSALQISLQSVGRPGDEVVIPVPCWLDYPLYVRSLGLEPVLVPVKSGSFDLDPETLSAAISEKTRAVILCQPSNPTGRTLGAGELEDFAAVIHAAEHRFGTEVTVISDETHRDFVPPGGFRSPGSFWDRTLIVYSFGKYHFMQGQRLGYVAASPKHPDRKKLTEELVLRTRITGIATPTSIMQLAIPGLLALHHDNGWLDIWRERFIRKLSELGYDPVIPDSTMFIYARTPEPHGDFDFTEQLARAGLLVLPAPVFHHEGYFRLSLTGSEWMMERALSILKESASK